MARKLSSVSVESKIKLMHELVDASLEIVVSDKWGSLEKEYRAAIRHHLGDHFTKYFNKEQWAQLYDLNSLPQAMKGIQPAAQLNLRKHFVTP